MAEFFRRDLPESGYDTTDFSRIQGLRGVVLNPDALSGGAVQLDARGVMAMGEGAARFGQGVANVGGDMLAVANEQMRAVAIRQETDAENAMADAEGKIQIAITEQQDETKWGGIAQQHIASFEESLNGREMTAAARDAIRMKVAGWKNQVGHFVGMASARRSVERAREGIEAKAVRMREAGDYAGLNTMLRQPGTTHYMGAAWVAGQEVAAVKHAEAKRKEAEFNAEYDAIQKDPDAWLLANKTRPEGRDAAVHDRLVSEAKGVKRETVAADWNRFEEAVASGALTVSAEVAEWEKDNPRITPEMRREAAASLFRRNDAVQKEIARANAPENMARLVIEARSLNPETDSDEKFAAIQNRISELPEGYRQLPRDILTAKWRNREKLDEPPETARSLGLSIIKSMFDRGMMGSFDNGTGKDKDGNPVSAPGSSPDEVHVRDPKQFENAKVKAADIGGKFIRWHNLNPQATPEEIQAKVYELLPEGTRARILDRRDRPAPADATDKTTAGTGDNIDLPGGSGAPTGPGIMPAPGEPAPQSGITQYVADDKKSVEVVPMTTEDIDRWKSAGEKPAEVWDSLAGKFVTIPPSKLIPGRHFMPASFLPQ